MDDNGTLYTLHRLLKTRRWRQIERTKRIKAARAKRQQQTEEWTKGQEYRYLRREFGPGAFTCGA